MDDLPATSNVTYLGGTTGIAKQHRGGSGSSCLCMGREGITLRTDMDGYGRTAVLKTTMLLLASMLTLALTRNLESEYSQHVYLHKSSFHMARRNGSDG
jgi:hypothetical protein